MKFFPLFLLALCAALSLFPRTGNADQLMNGEVSYGNGNYENALKILQPLAEQGNAKAQLDVGIMYMNGQGVAKNYPAALVWFRKAADQGDAEAQNDVGRFYDQGLGVARDYAQSQAWFIKAAAQGNPSAALSLGFHYTLTRGVPRDDAEAYFWMDVATKQYAAIGDEANLQTANMARDRAGSQLKLDQKEAVLKRVRDWQPVPASVSPATPAPAPAPAAAPSKPLP